MRAFKQKYKKERGFTLLELVLIIPLVAIVFLITYNILFISFRSMNYVNKTFNTSEEVRIFLNNIQKEASQAKKAVEDEEIGPLYRKSEKELYIYTDVNGEKPELIRYRLEDGNILRDVKEATNEKYPYEFEESFKKERVVLSNIENKNVFGKIEDVKDKKNIQEGEDYRKKLKLNIEIFTEENSTPIKINTYLVSKSRASFH